MGVPHSDDVRIASNEQEASGLFPVHYDTGSATHANDLAQPAESAHHLNISVTRRWIVVTVKSNHAVS
jgi:hypothetical protein